MGIQERIKQLCKEHGIAVSKLERELGFSNAYITQMNPDAVPYNRLIKIAEYFGVTPEYLITGETTDGYYFDPATAVKAQEILNNKELSLLFDAARDASPDDLKVVHEMLLALKRKEHK